MTQNANNCEGHTGTVAESVSDEYLGWESVVLEESQGAHQEWDHERQEESDEEETLAQERTHFVDAVWHWHVSLDLVHNRSWVSNLVVVVELDFHPPPYSRSVVNKLQQVRREDQGK